MQMLWLMAGRLGMTIVWLIGCSFLAAVAYVTLHAMYLYVVSDPHTFWFRGLALSFLSLVAISCGVGLIVHTAVYRKFLKIFRG